MRLYDQHVHSKHSFDSETEPAEMCRQALEQGLAGVTFTEHFDTHPTEWPRCRLDYRRLVEEHAALRAEFGERLQVGLGLEVAIPHSCHSSSGRPIHMLTASWRDLLHCDTIRNRAAKDRFLNRLLT